MSEVIGLIVVIPRKLISIIDGATALYPIYSNFALIDKYIVSINGVELDVRKDVYDFRKE